MTNARVADRRGGDPCTPSMSVLLPPSAVVVEAFADDPGDVPFAGEEHLIAGTVQSRRREFITTRRCARQALGVLGHPATAVPAGRRREPRWPAGVVGSITHCPGYRAAAVAPRAEIASLGIDAESHEPLPDDVLPVVTLAAERALLRRLAAQSPAVHWDRVLFSAKESVYKSWHPLTGRWLGFEDASLAIDPATSSFRARLLVDGTRTDGGPPLRELRGHYRIAEGLVLTAVTVPHGP